METIGDYISFIFLLVLGIWVGSLIHTYYMRQILTEIKKMNQGTPSDPKTIPTKPVPKGSLGQCSDCNTGYRADGSSCPECGGSGFVYTKKESRPRRIF
jgi:hypothetical protein